MSHAQEYQSFVNEISYLTKTKDVLPEAVAERVLNGAAYSALRSLVPLEKRRDAGAFFTNHSLADRVAAEAVKKVGKNATFADPACGAGDLLIAVAKKLPLKHTYQRTLKDWSDKLYGFDIQPEFVKTTRLRLMLLAAHRCGVPPSKARLAGHFRNIKTGDALDNLAILEQVKCVVVNPPYTCVDAPSEYKWGQGNVNSAALFLDGIVNSLKPNSYLFAILPEVIRCGSRYSKLRGFLSLNTKKLFTKKLGVFDAWTDVDVYFCAYKKIQARKDSKKLKVNKSVKGSVGSHFSVHVGAVVPHRNPDSGTKRPYLDTSHLDSWGKISKIKDKRGFSGTLFKPPFVAIKRTSRPDESERAIGTIISGKSLPVAVENHIIVAIPHDKTVKSCKKLIKKLRSKKALKHLNRVIRCRHLTVHSIRSVPWSR